MTWAEVCIHTTNEALEPITNILYEAGASGVVIEDPIDLNKPRNHHFGEIYELDPTKYPSNGIYIKVYFPNDQLLTNKVESIKNSIHQLKKLDIDIGENSLTISTVEEEDWETSWQKYYKPVNISNQITIVPKWHDYKPLTSEEIMIYLDPGMAFGTGTHPTTKLSILALEKYVQKYDLVLDVGCGSGVLSIASCLLGAKKVLAYDVDEIAIKSTQTNRDLNNLHDEVIVSQNDLLKGIEQHADIVVANILAEIIMDLIDQAWLNLKKDGLFIASGIILNKKKMVSEAIENKGFKIVEIDQMENWVCIVAKKE